MKPVIRKIALVAAIAVALCTLAACAPKTAAYSTEAADEAGEERVFYSTDPIPVESSVSGSAGIVQKNAVNAAAGEDTSAASPYGRKIVYNATLELTADDPRAVLNTVSARCAALGGYLSASYERTRSDGTVQITATVKVPAEGLNDLLDELKKLGRVGSSRLSSDDISQSYYDVEARLRAAEAEEEQLLVLLERCQNVEEMLAVREQLSYVRSDIESYRATIDRWDHQVAYATIDLSIDETAKTAAETDDGTVALRKFSDIIRRMKNGLANSWRSVVNAAGAVAIFLSNALIPATVIGAIVFGAVRLVKALWKRKALGRGAEKAAGPEQKEKEK